MTLNKESYPGDLSKYCIYSKDGVVYNCLLNQVDIGSNSNKFYILQILHNNDFILYIRFGRVGEKGRIETKIFKDYNLVYKAFCEKFNTKTGNSWHNRDNFIKKNKKYYLISNCKVEVEENKEDKKEENIIEVEELEEIKQERLIFEKKVQKLFELIATMQLLKNTLAGYEINEDKLPMKNINKKIIEDSKKILIFLEKNLEYLSRHEIEDHSSQFYTLIPHSFGRNRPMLIDNLNYIKILFQKLEDLENLSCNYKIIVEKNNFYNIYKDVNRKILLLEDDYKLEELRRYVKNTIGETHHVKLTCEDIYEIEYTDEDNKKFYILASEKYDDNIELLIHGSRLCNWISILKHGLVLNPENFGASITGKMFGNGIYFANSFSKSAQYCGNDDTICIALAEVLLGKPLELTNSYNVTSSYLKTTRKDYTYGLGKRTPESSINFGKCKVPNGKLKYRENISNYYLQYDEKIIYSTEQYRMKYLLVLKRN